jgi:hypothetical protein
MSDSWSRAIDFHCKFGVWPFQKTLDITPDGFAWCGELFPHKSVTRLRWGVDQKRGGVFPKYSYIAAFGTDERDFSIRTKQKDFYEALTTRMWKAAGPRLLSALASKLAAGGRARFGSFSVGDEGVYTTDKPMFGEASEIFTPWNRLEWGVYNGSLCFAAGEGGKFLASASFLWTDNAHVLDAALELLKKNGAAKISAAVK